MACSPTNKPADPGFVLLQVCQSKDDYRGFDGELGLCVCKESPGRAACGGLCRSRAATALRLQCRYDGGMELVWSRGRQVNGGNFGCTYINFNALNEKVLKK